MNIYCSSVGTPLRVVKVLRADEMVVGKEVCFKKELPFLFFVKGLLCNILEKNNQQKFYIFLRIHKPFLNILDSI